MYKFILCVDPQTITYYSYNLTNFELHIEEFKSLDMRDVMREKARKACNELQQVISWANFKKMESEAVWRYRRRILPTYLLRESKQKLPAYIIEEPMPNSLSEQLEGDEEKGQLKRRYRPDIDVEISLDEYYGQLRQKYNEQIRIPSIIKCKLKLVTSVNEIMKIIYKTAFQQREIEILPHNPKNKLVLRVHSAEDYLYGHTPLMNYMYIRKCLRAKEVAKLVLTEQFIEEHGQLRRAIIFREITEVDLGVYREADWDIMVKQQPILWYPPYKLTPEAIADIKQRENLRMLYDIENDKTAQIRKENPFFQSEQMENIRVKLRLLREPQPQRPRFMLKEQCIKVTDMRKTEVERRIIEVGQSLMYSGQCQSVFQLRLSFCSGLLKIFKFHPKMNSTSSYQDKLTPFSSHFEYNSGLWTALKKLEVFPFVPYAFVVKTLLTYGDRILSEDISIPVILSNNSQINHVFSWKEVNRLPLQAKLFFTISIMSKELQIANAIEVGCAAINIFDDRGCLRQGKHEVILWPYQSVDLRISGCIGNFNGVLADKGYTKLMLEFPRYVTEMQWSLCSDELIHSLGYLEYNLIVPPKGASEDTKDLAKLDQLLRCDPIKMLSYSDRQKELLQSCKNHYCKLPDKYINYLFSVDWSEPDQVRRAIKSREEWEALSPSDCLPLLSQKILDEAIRFYAVERMTSMTDDEIVLYMLQLVQALTVQSTHHNPLSEFLLQRSVMSPHRVGHSFFWQLRSQLNKPFEFQRYALYLQALMMLSKHRQEFCDQLKVNRTLTQTAELVVKEQGGIDQKGNYFKQKLLPKLKGQLPSPFVLAINPEKKNDGFLEKQCKVFDSKKVPLLLTLIEDPVLHRKEASSPTRLKPPPTQKLPQEPIVLQRVIFKSGDDIRQDQLTLQVLKLMDNIWLDAGYDFKMSIYRVLPVDDMIGYIEVVENAQNNSSIHTKYGGSMGALNDKTFELYLRQYNKTREQYRNARDNFIRSNVGYLVASYVLGLGDRHSGNAMITRNGMFFHIDFGHFLGNFKEKLKIKRERSPFLFTSEFVHVIGGRESEAFKEFEQLCGIAYNLIRKNASIIINMFLMMVAAGIPELYNYNNIDYLVEKLSLQMSAQQAAQKIKQQIAETLNSETSRRLDNLVHEIKRNG